MKPVSFMNHKMKTQGFVSPKEMFMDAIARIFQVVRSPFTHQWSSGNYPRLRE
uniref:Uncharacterized protein n=1 Tax=Anguilla anguilla TaxID=7936 RepID=A0A0E9VVN1_ANGAN